MWLGGGEGGGGFRGTGGSEDVSMVTRADFPTLAAILVFPLTTDSIRLLWGP